MKDAVVMRAEQIAVEYLQERVTESYQILGKGSVNQVCVVKTGSRTVVVRMNDAGSYAGFVKEKWCIEQSAAVGIPGPEVLSIGIAENTAYMVQTFVAGDNGLDSAVPKSLIWRRLGEYARRFQSIRVSGFGEELVDQVHGVFRSPPHPGSDGSWLGYVQYNINSLTEKDQLIELGVLTLAASRKVRALFENLKRATFRFGLIHNDLSLKNTIVNEAGQVYLLDWENAEVSAAPHEDLIELLKCQMLGGSPDQEEFKAFLDGYGLGEEDLAVTRHLMLLRAFDKLRWAIDRSPDQIEPFAAYAKQVVDMVLD
ncbi:aminoglycoside phosphotransferase family protein [Paenibacillus montanisoli]|uniref:Aminoglycoside phosphotransferase family protein n=1 Tax=Paenibacillus montanisoli TaxID=2081970 RepID=A0A328UBR4_9BACL|nr:aminoglycoside phosphotransferase family protein [Paenibacillus montanisoli]RAP77774.1 aminoglycoside phosphotransferase family protein [Paenibacillus montanisoli]